MLKVKKESFLEFDKSISKFFLYVCIVLFIFFNLDFLGYVF